MVMRRDPRWRTGKRNGPEPAIYYYLQYRNVTDTRWRHILR